MSILLQEVILNEVVRIRALYTIVALVLYFTKGLPQ